MFNLKKIEPKFPKLNINQLQRQMSYLTNNNNEEFNDFDINISETDIDAFYFKKKQNNRRSESNERKFNQKKSGRIKI